MTIIIITKEEFSKFLAATDVNQALVVQYKRILVLQTIIAVMIVAALACVTAIAVEASKESHVSDSVFVDSGDNAVQCASKTGTW